MTFTSGSPAGGPTLNMREQGPRPALGERRQSLVPTLCRGCLQGRQGTELDPNAPEVGHQLQPHSQSQLRGQGSGGTYEAPRLEAQTRDLGTGPWDAHPTTSQASVSPSVRWGRRLLPMEP